MAVDCCPYYIHHIVDELCQRGSDTPTADIVDSCLIAGNDPWDLRHYRERIDPYYLPDERPFVLHLLDILAASDIPLAFNDLFDRLKAHMTTEDSEKARHVLRLLQEDHYLTRHANGTWHFRFALMQRWWRLERGISI